MNSYQYEDNTTSNTRKGDDEQGRALHSNQQGQGGDHNEGDDNTQNISLYMGNIAAACEAVNADCKQPFRSEEEKLDERRVANRVSAKMSRERKKMERDQLESTQASLMDHNKALREENNELRKQIDILLLKQRNTEGTTGHMEEWPRQNIALEQNNHNPQHNPLSFNFSQHQQQQPMMINFGGAMPLSAEGQPHQEIVLSRLMDQELQSYPAFIGQYPPEMAQMPAQQYHRHDHASVMGTFSEIDPSTLLATVTNAGGGNTAYPTNMNWFSNAAFDSSASWRENVGGVASASSPAPKRKRQKRSGTPMSPPTRKKK